MIKQQNVQHTGSPHVRSSKGVSRLRVALASTGVTSALLLGSVLGATGLAHAAPAQSALSHTATAQMTTLSSRGNLSYVSIARQAALAAGISPDLFVRQIQQESGFNPRAVSPSGAVGIAQFMPATAASMGVNPYDPTSALYGGARFMANLSAQFGGNYAKALAAYNGGPGTVIHAVNAGGGNWINFLPTESRNYVHIIMG